MLHIMHKQKKIWDTVYSNYSPAKLPWTDIILPESVLAILEQFDKKQLLIMPGCGTGESVNKVYQL